MLTSPEAPRSKSRSLELIEAATSVTIVLTAIASPNEAAVALPFPPLAIASERPPAIAKML